MQKKLQPSAVLGALMAPVVRFCLKRGIRIRELDEAIRKTLVDEARSAIEDAAGQVSVSKISVVTGIHRVEVGRLLAGERRPRGKHDVLNRIIGLWTQRSSYRDAIGLPQPLSFQGLNSEFAELVSRVSKEVSHYPILFELERTGAIDFDGEMVKLKVVEYTPQGDAEHGLQILSDDITELLQTVEGNLTDHIEAPDLHLRTSYDNIPPEHLEDIRTWVLSKGAQFQAEVREYLSKFDRDINPTVTPGVERAKVTVSVFSLGRALEHVKQLKPRKRGRKRAAKKE